MHFYLFERFHFGIFMKKNWKQHLEQFSPQKLYLSRKWVRSGIFLSVRPAQRLFGYLPKRYKNGNIFSALFASWYNSSVTEMKMYNLSSAHFDYLTLGVSELLLAHFVKNQNISKWFFRFLYLQVYYIHDGSEFSTDVIIFEIELSNHGSVSSLPAELQLRQRFQLQISIRPQNDVPKIELGNGKIQCLISKQSIF